jgi:hypothetical protein
MKNRKSQYLYVTSAVFLLGLIVLFYLKRNEGFVEKKESVSTKRQEPSITSAQVHVSKHQRADNIANAEELSVLIKRLSSQGGDANTLFKSILPMRIPEKPWWRGSGDFSSLLAVATDKTVSEAGRMVAIRFYLTGVSKAELEKQSESVQKMFSDASDPMVSAVLQDMADRQVPPRSLILQTLENPQRGENARCHAWYAARLTDSTNPAFAALAIREYKKGWTANSKVAFDFLAAAPHFEQFEAAPVLRQTVDDLVEHAKTLPATAGIMEMANADALIIALPKIMEGGRTKQALAELLHNAPNPELRLSALEQVIKLHTSGIENMTTDLNAIKKNITSIFPEQSNQIRANAFLKRLQ